MPSSDQIVSFLLSAVLHIAGLLLLGSQAERLAEPSETAPELKVSSVELALATIEPAVPSDSAAEGAGGPQQEKPLQPQDRPQPAEQPAPPAPPAKPAITEALPPPPEPAPKPVPAPEPTPAPKPAPAPEPAPEPAPAPAPAPPQQPAAAPQQPAAAPQPTPQPAPAATSPATAGRSTSAPATAVAGASDRAVILPANGGGGPYGRIDAHPALNRPIKPNYPIGARRRGEEGTVILDVVVAEDGTAKTVSRVSGSGFSELDAAAERAAAKARFKPGTRDGKPVLSAARITIIFRLRDA